MPDELHFPPGAEPKPEPAPEPKPDAPAPDNVPEPKSEDKPSPEAPKPEEDKPEDKDTPADPPAPIKKRSIYDDLKDTRQEKNAWRDAAVSALKAQGIELTGKEAPEELQTLAKSTPAPKPQDEPKPAAPKEDAPVDDLEAFAKENDIDPKAMSRLVDIISKRIPAAQLTEAEKADLAELKTWRETQARQDEDNAITAQRDSVKALAKDLGFEIHVEAEADQVMKEIVRLAHTTAFHDKPVDYIVFANRAALSKLISPKKPSFENGGGKGEAEPVADVEFNGKMTPEAAQKAVHAGTPKSTLEIRRSS